jgi:alpha/beta superfamily hydrolase
MEMPAQLRPTLIGAAFGAATLAIIGFTWGGWVTSSTAEAQARMQASIAVVAALAPICVANFRQDKDAATQLASLKKARSWEQGGIVEKAGWAKIPGVASVDSDVARICAEQILANKT